MVTVAPVFDKSYVRKGDGGRFECFHGRFLMIFWQFLPPNKWCRLRLYCMLQVLGQGGVYHLYLSFSLYKPK